MQMTFILCGILLIWITHKITYNESVVFKFTNAVSLHPVTNIFAEFQVFKRENGYKPWLVKTSWDLCRFLTKAYNPFAILFYRMFKEFTNINHTCPYEGDLVVEGFHLRPELLGVVLPTGDYRAATTWFVDNKKQFIVNAYAAFTEDLL
ncbi:uncharacterized protein LOC127565414 [Drosophila albomicans]|uniref:Uncharacterized protein LOC127565414 n=1 Tax=Drosophila albomicans TaxID=7291 RepID=A0A9C6WE23_DROAB|nr:uncharacterized protein LOC127565414 [Drosophila albomicans]